MKELFSDINQWADRTFPQPRLPSGPIQHLKRECDEILRDPTDYTEYADALILVLNAAHCAGMTYETLLAIAERKMLTNKARKWGKPDTQGVCEHVREPISDAAGYVG